MSVAVVGCGYWGQNHARTLAQLGALTAIVDPNPETAAREAAKNNVAAMTWAQCLADPAITAVSIAAPAELHVPLGREAIAAGKDVLVEKPISLSVADGALLAGEAKAAGRILMVGHVLLYNPSFEALLGLIADGALGKLRYAHSNRLSMGKFRLEENVLWSFAVHDVSMLLALFGGAPAEVRCTGRAYVTPGVQDEVQLEMLFEDGGHAHVFASWLHPFKEHRLVVVGDKASAVLDDGKKSLIVYPYSLDAGPGAPVPAKGDEQVIDFAADLPLTRELQHFLDCCRTRSQPRSDAEEALRVLRVLSDAQKALDAA
jgi:UDP-2-acetamido-3-amino-2,3-dideoxy-glucuronate N-acetyltransferase